MRRLLSILVVLSLGLAACGDAHADDDRSDPSTLDSQPSQLTDTGPTTAQPAPFALEPATLRFGSLTERVVDVQADGTKTTAAVESMNQFAIDLYSAVTESEEGNVILSPYSVSFALSMIYAGAAGETAQEMADVLHIDQPAEDWHEGINAYDLTLTARTEGSTTDWASANKIWTRPGIHLENEFLDVLTGAYGAPLAEADFVSDPEEQRHVINEWVSANTNDLIPELWPENSFSGKTALVLVNAVALDAPWEFPFDPSATSTRPFTLADGSNVDVETMRYDEFLPSLWTEQYQVVELPYGDGALSMVVIAPTDLAEFEAKLTNESLNEILDEINDGGIHLSMPKWSARTALRLNDVLKAMGMPSAFGGGADFSAMTGGGGLRLDFFQHEAFVEVDEAGTRAAAASGGAMVGSHGPTITIDRPFLYVIRDKGAGTILFIGRVMDPTVVP